MMELETNESNPKLGKLFDQSQKLKEKKVIAKYERNEIVNKKESKNYSSSNNSEEKISSRSWMRNCVERIGGLFDKFRDLYAKINQLTISGACDVVVVPNPDTGQLEGSPFYVRFGFLDLVVPKRHEVNIIVNEVETDVKLYVGDSGIAYFSGEQKMSSPNLVEDAKQCIENNSDKESSPPKCMTGESFYNEESVMDELENEIEKDSIDFNKELVNPSADIEEKLPVSHRLKRINSWVKRYYRKSINTETSASMNFDLNNLDHEMIAIFSEDNCTRTQDGYPKTLYMTSEQLESLNLKPGCNDVTYKIATAFQGTKRIRANIFLWKSTDKLVISDVDGTVTKSNMLGHFLPLFGKQWHQQYVSKLFKRIENNGYKFIYISMRPLGYSSLTKKQLTSIKINDTNLPPGPLILCPLTLFSSMSVEIVFKVADIMKVELFKPILSLFGKYSSPIYSGFGNTGSDQQSYEKLGIESHLNFIINTKGEVLAGQDKTRPLTYKIIHDKIDEFFPKLD